MLDEKKERALLVGIELRSSTIPLQESLDELERLADTAGCTTVLRTFQRLDSPNPKTYIGSGKAEEIWHLVEENDIEVVIFDEELSPSQQSALEAIIHKAKIIDRTALILDIFALHATTREGRLQVRLAQNQYLYPRLRGMWAHLASNKMGGGVGSRFGEGESQLEVDRRMVRNRISSIQKELAELEKNRSLQRKNRKDAGIFRISLCGYTNAGKSSLLNTLTSSDVLVYDKLFATLDATTRKLVLPEGREVTLTDTVGFVQKLPHSLVESFHSTLEEICESNLILHVVDASSLSFESHLQATSLVLEEIQAEKIPSLLIFNKVDLLTEAYRDSLSHRFPSALFVSSKTGYGLDSLISRISLAVSSSDAYLNVLIPFTRGDLVKAFHTKGSIISEEYTNEGTHITGRCPNSCAHLFQEYMLNPS